MENKMEKVLTRCLMEEQEWACGRMAKESDGLMKQKVKNSSKMKASIDTKN